MIEQGQNQEFKVSRGELQPINTIEKYWDNESDSEHTPKSQKIEDLGTFVHYFNLGVIEKTLFVNGKQISWIYKDLFQYFTPEQCKQLYDNTQPVIELENLDLSWDQIEKT